MSWGLEGMHAINVNLGTIFYTKKQEKSKPNMMNYFRNMQNFTF